MKRNRTTKFVTIGRPVLFVDDGRIGVVQPSLLEEARKLAKAEGVPASTDLKASLKATCFVGNRSLNKAASPGIETK